MEKKRGRPKKDDAKNDVFNLRIDDEYRNILEELSAKTGKTKSEIARRCLKIGSDCLSLLLSESDKNDVK